MEREGKDAAGEAGEMGGKTAEYRERAVGLHAKLGQSQMEQMARSAAMAQKGAHVAGQANAAVKTAGGYSTVAGAAAIGVVAGAVVL